jgi:NitT/TauT family transport system permease protein
MRGSAVAIKRAAASHPFGFLGRVISTFAAICRFRLRDWHDRRPDDPPDRHRFRKAPRHDESQHAMKSLVLLAQLAFVALLIGAWELASHLGAFDPQILPPPSAVTAEMVALLHSKTFLTDAFDTVVRVIAAFVIGAPIALAVGFVMGENIGVGKSLAPVFNIVLAVPQSIFLPIFVLVFGLGFTQKLVFGITHVFFVVAVNAMAAVREVPYGQVVAARAFGAHTVRIYRSIYLPAMAPQIVTGLRLGMIFDIIGILLAEMYASKTGLGVLLLRWGESYAVDKLMAATVLISIATILINELMRIWEAHVGRWRHAMDAA